MYDGIVVTSTWSARAGPRCRGGNELPPNRNDQGIVLVLRSCYGNVQRIPFIACPPPTNQRGKLESTVLYSIAATILTTALPGFAWDINAGGTGGNGEARRIASTAYSS